MGGTAADSHGFPCARDMTQTSDVWDRVPSSRNRSCVNTHPGLPPLFQIVEIRVATRTSVSNGRAESDDWLRFSATKSNHPRVSGIAPCCGP